MAHRLKRANRTYCLNINRAPESYCSRLISLCANWTGLGPHIALLKEILAMKSDLLEDSRHDTEHWPLPIPIWPIPGRANEIRATEIPDPFLIRFFRECSKHAFGWSVSTYLANISNLLSCRILRSDAVDGCYFMRIHRRGC